MAKKIFDITDKEILDSISSEQDLNLRPGIIINPPPDDARCMCCGRHISELKPFGKAGDPLVGDFDGAFLVKKFRSLGPHNEEAVKALENAEKHLAEIARKSEDPLHWRISVYGKEKGEYFYWASQASAYSSKSWECCDCTVLDEDEYFEKLKQSM
jgi:hypothetical protein